jgi:site-specific DNA-methyltransferase (adenine-specific)
MIGMARYPDKYFDLAIVDPPFREKNDPMQSTRDHTTAKDAKRREMLNIGLPPNDQYFTELSRVSQNQIIMGGNYFTEFLPANNNWIIWYKNNDGVGFSMAELFWSSITKNVKVLDMRPMGLNGDKVHPVQKPVALYKWLLANYAKPGDKILDTHVGSASSLISCYDMGFDAVGFELDPDYYKASMQRLQDFMKQPRIEQYIDQFEQIGMEGT